MNKKRLVAVALLLIAIGLVPIFAAGGAEQQSGGEEIELTPVGTYPVSEELITIEAVIPSIPNVIDYNTNTFTLWMEEQTNIRMDFDQVPQSALAEKVTLLLASGDYPEVFLKSEITPAQEITYGAAEGIFLDLRDLISEKAPNFQAIMNSSAGLEGFLTSTDGAIYSLPMINECYHCLTEDKFWINSYWLDELGLDMPKTIEEFKAAMIAIRDGDPNGNGKNDEIPITGATPGWFNLFPALMNPFILSNDEKITIIEQNGDVVVANAQPEYRDGLRWMNELFEEGLIYGTTFTQNRDQLRALAAQPDELLGSFVVGGLFGVLNPNNFPDRYRHYEVVPPLQGPAGQQTGLYYWSAYNPGQYVITDRAKSPEAAIRWVDLYYTYEAELNGYYGEEGVHWRDAPAGTVGLTGEPAVYEVLVPFTQEPQNNNWYHHFYAPGDVWFGAAVDPDIDPYTAEGLERLLYDASVEKMVPHVAKSASLVPPLRLTQQELDELATLTVELENYIENSKVRFITGDLDIESDWDSYVESLSDIGLDRFVEIQQTAYNRQFR